VLRRGEGVVTYGFPLAGLPLLRPDPHHRRDLGAGRAAPTTSGSSRSARRVQPGQFRRPLLDRAATWWGVDRRKLNAQRVAQRTGDIPQNVNIAEKGSEAIAFPWRQNRWNRVCDGTRTAARREVGESGASFAVVHAVHARVTDSAALVA
jgi:hypothetical protein